MPPQRMTLKLLLPFQVFAEKTGLSRLVVETREGEYGLLPHRLDCVAALAPGILTYQTEEERTSRSVLAKMESSLVSRMASLYNA